MDANALRFLARAQQLAARPTQHRAAVLAHLEHLENVIRRAARTGAPSREHFAWFLVALRRAARHGDAYSRHAVAQSPAGVA